MNTNGMRPIHPGEILKKEFLEPLSITATGSLNELVMRDRSVSSGLAMELSILLNTTPEFWLNLQSTYDRRRADIERG